MLGSQSLFGDRQSPHQQRLRLHILPLLLIQQREIVEDASSVGTLHELCGSSRLPAHALPAHLGPLLEPADGPALISLPCPSEGVSRSARSSPLPESLPRLWLAVVVSEAFAVLR